MKVNGKVHDVVIQKVVGALAENSPEGNYPLDLDQALLYLLSVSMPLASADCSWRKTSKSKLHNEIDPACPNVLQSIPRQN